ncbi:MAG: RagB/SusD family nutrient uptake outer membrane protein, partial [Muribaculaceae bacterium]|nr:RagB/SusD family nutrient uptake outer membrane protein [Muribaculaceae bacterium]
MNKILRNSALTVLAAVTAAGCSDFLDEDLKSQLAPDNTYTSSMGFEVGCTGLYAIARSEYNTWGESGAFMHNGACAYATQQIATDIVFQSGAKDGSLTPYANLTMTPST